MLRGKIWTILVVVLSLLPACQIDLSRGPLAAFLSSTLTNTLISSPTASATSTPTLTPTPTSTFAPSPTPTNTPTPTPTPVPSDRLALAQQAYTNGDYDTARREFAALLADPGADPNEKRLALHWRGRSELNLGDSQAAIASLTQFLRQYPSDELARPAQFNLALAYEQSGQYKEAVQSYLGCIVPDDPVNVYIYERIGDAAILAGEYTGAIEAYRAGLKSTAEAGFQVHLRESIAQAELARGQPQAALAQYDAILGISKIDAYRAKILRLAGVAHLAAGQTDAAYKRYLEAVNRYPDAYDSYLALVELVNANVPVDEFQRGLVDYYAAAYEPAVAAFERYLTEERGQRREEGREAEGAEESGEAGGGESITQTVTLTNTQPVTATAALPARAADAVWYSALSWQQLGRYNNALKSFDRLIKDYPASPNWGQAHLEMGKVLADQDNLDQARSVWRDFARANPRHPLAAEALWRAARLELDHDLFDEAHTNMLALTKTYPAGDYADDALYWAGQAAFKLGNYDQAITDWETLTKSYPASDLASFAGYWQAKTLLLLGREDEAKKILTPLTHRTLDYYGLRAHDLLDGASPQSQAATSLNLPDAARLTVEQAEAETWLKNWLGLPSDEKLPAFSAQVRADQHDPRR